MKNKQLLHYSAVLCCLSAALLCACTGDAYGYTVSTYNGHEIKWPAPSADYYINPSGFPAAAPQAIQAALQTWTDVATSSFSFVYQGETSSTAYGVSDGTNLICFGSLSGGSTLALNTFWFTAQGTLLDSDIKFNSKFAWATDGSAGAYDVQTVVLHELGHALSLEDLYGAGDTAKVMYGYVSAGSIKRALSQDDKDGITYLYPVGGGTTTSTIQTTTTTIRTTTTSTIGGGGGTTPTPATTTALSFTTTTTTTNTPSTTTPSTITPSTTTTVGTYGLCPAQKVLGADNPKLENLRAFRDGLLAQSKVGRRITQIYYDNADSINAAFERSPALRAVAQKLFEAAASLAGGKQEQDSDMQ